MADSSSLDTDIEFHERLRRYEEQMHPEYALKFDGADLKGRVGIPNWRGGRPSWGNYRAWLAPEPQTETYGRGGFAIHGGSSPGSAGCIDLTDSMDEFVDLMHALGQGQVEVAVDYGPDGAPNHRPR